MRRSALQRFRRGFAAVAVMNSAFCRHERVALEIEAIDAFAGRGAHHTGLIALAILLEAVALLAVAPLEMSVSILQLFFARGCRRYLWLEGKCVALESGFNGGLAL